MSRVVDEIASAVIGLMLAGLSSLLVGALWSDMRIPAFLIFVLYWILTSIGDYKLGQHKGLVRTSSSGWKYMKRADFDKYVLRSKHSILTDIATILIGAIVGLLAGGLAGKISPIARWPVAIVVFVLWAFFIITAALNDRRES